MCHMGLSTSCRHPISDLMCDGLCMWGLHYVKVPGEVWCSQLPTSQLHLGSLGAVLPNLQHS
jgi:hypothetical protein